MNSRNLEVFIRLEALVCEREYMRAENEVQISRKEPLAFPAPRFEALAERMHALLPLIRVDP